VQIFSAETLVKKESKFPLKSFNWNFKRITRFETQRNGQVLFWLAVKAVIEKI
jgi:hypothetical protein